MACFTIEPIQRRRFVSGLHLGAPVSDRRRRFELPPELVTLTMAVLGIRGSGKTNTAVVLAEELLERGHQVVIIDPLDVWWGLKSSRDGKSAGHPVVVFGGHNGDLPLEAGSGKVLADLAVDRRMPMVLSLRHLRKGAQRELVTTFAEQFFHRKGEAQHRTPVLVIVDEASAFIPQRVGSSEARMVGAMEDLVRRGRNVGIGMVAIDQRAASVNKDVLTQLEVLVAHRHTSPQDRKALQEWIRAHDTQDLESAFMGAVASLTLGETFVWSPALDVFERVQVRERNTFDSSKTPELGEEVQLPEQWAELDLDVLREQLQETIEEAEANDPKALKKRIAELEREIRSVRNEAPEVDEAALRERIHDELLEEFTDGLHEKLAEAVQAGVEYTAIKTSGPLAHLGELIANARDATEAVEVAAEELAGALADVVNDPPMPEDLEVGGFSPLPRQSSRPQRETIKAPPANHQGSADRDVAAELSPRHQRILDAARRLEVMGIASPSRSVLAAVAEYSPRSSGYEKAVSRLSSLGLVHYPSAGDVALTPEGRALAAAPDQPVTLEELHAGFFRILDPRHVRILKPLIAIYPRALSREELAERAEYSALSSGYEKAVSRLSSFGLVHYPQPGHVAAAELLFPEGLR